MHRDFKLENIFVNDEQIILGDFGYSKIGEDLAKTRLGTLCTMAPEIINPVPNAKGYD